MSNKTRVVPYKDEGVIIVVSSIASTFTYILVSKILDHWVHPIMIVLLVVGLISLFGFVLVLFRLQKKTSA